MRVSRLDLGWLAHLKSVNRLNTCIHGILNRLSWNSWIRCTLIDSLRRLSHYRSRLPSLRHHLSSWSGTLTWLLHGLLLLLLLLLSKKVLVLKLHLVMLYLHFSWYQESSLFILNFFNLLEFFFLLFYVVFKSEHFENLVY